MTANNASDLPQVSDRLAKNAMRNVSERIIEAILFSAAAVSVLTTAGIVYVLISESILFFQHVGIVEFLTDTQWTPLFDDAHFGIMVLVSGTLVSSFVALAVAIPMGTIIAISPSEFANPKVREIAKPILELLGGIPTIVFGYFALLIVTPVLQKIFPELPGFSLLSAGLVMGIMLGHCRGLHPRHLARRRRDDGRGHRRRHAAQLHFQPHRVCGHHHRLHRAGEPR